MKRAIAIIAAVSISLPAAAGMIAMKSFDGTGNNGIALLSEACSSDNGKNVLHRALMKNGGSVAEGCWVRNNRNNIVIMWIDDKSMQEMDGSEFEVVTP